MNNNPTGSNVRSANIPEGGTLGILAYGYRGIMAWRAKRNELAQNRLAQLQKSNPGNEEN